MVDHDGQLHLQVHHNAQYKMNNLHLINSLIIYYENTYYIFFNNHIVVLIFIFKSFMC